MMITLAPLQTMMRLVTISHHVQTGARNRNTEANLGKQGAGARNRKSAVQYRKENNNPGEEGDRE